MGKSVWTNDAHQDAVYTLSFGGDSQSFISGCEDGVCSLWDLHRTFVPTPNDADLESHWDTLSLGHGTAADIAFGALVEKPDRAVAIAEVKLLGVETLLDPRRR
jgi:hypothetical protein